MIVPLDWGLGHATRCIPLIRELLVNGCEVIIGAENATRSLLEHEFQQLRFIPLQGYRARYSKKRRLLAWKLIAQVPQILLAIYKEHRWLKKVVKKYAISAILADNRFGLYHPDIPSVYITHQLLIKTGNRLTEKLLQKIHGWFIKKYTFCWIPDFEGKQNLSGELSHIAKPPGPINYIGPLSRFEKKPPLEKKYDLLMLVSGPEPQRSIFETMLLTGLRDYHGNVLLVRGLPGANKGQNIAFPRRPQLVIKDHLAASELNEAVAQSEMVISRSGYTTIMDLVKLQQKGILVPTPGQTEQEYLAWHLMKQDYFYATSQEEFTLADALKQAVDFPFAIPLFDMELYKKKVAEFVQTLEQHG